MQTARPTGFFFYAKSCSPHGWLLAHWLCFFVNSMRESLSLSSKRLFMLARWMKDWKTVCKLALGPHYMHVILCGRLGFCQNNVGWKGSRSDVEPHCCWLTFILERICCSISQTQHHGGFMKEAQDSMIHQHWWWYISMTVTPHAHGELQ